MNSPKEIANNYIYSAGICRQVSWSMHLPGRTDYGTPRWK